MTILDFLQDYAGMIAMLIALHCIAGEALRRIFFSLQAAVELRKNEIMDFMDPKFAAMENAMLALSRRPNGVEDNPKEFSESPNRIEDRQIETSGCRDDADERIKRIEHLQIVTFVRLNRTDVNIFEMKKDIRAMRQPAVGTFINRKPDLESDQRLNWYEDRQTETSECLNGAAERLKRIDERQKEIVERLKWTNETISGIKNDILAIWQLAEGSFVIGKPDQGSDERLNRVEDLQIESSERLDGVGERLNRAENLQKEISERLKWTEETISDMQQDIRAIWQPIFGSFFTRKPGE